MPATKKDPKLHTLVEAKIRANRIKENLSPFCKDDKCVIAGSIRRKRPSVEDIEIVCIPKRGTAVPSGQAFAKPDVNLLVKHLRDHQGSTARDYVIKKGGDRYHQVLFCGMKADIFMTTAQQWGRMLALRTGPDSYSKKMAVRWKEKGFKGVSGELLKMKSGKPSTRNPQPATPRYKPKFPTEKSFFDFLGWEYVQPQNRN